MKYLTLVFIIFSVTAYSQQSERWIDEIEHPKSARHQLSSTDFKAKYLNHDFSQLLIPKSEFLGFIGNDFKRIQIEFKQIKKSMDSSSIYILNGNSTVGNNTCDFNGLIRIKKIKEFKNLHLGVDEIYADSGIVSQGIVFAEYEIKESKDQKYSGAFKGVMTLWFYIDSLGNIRYDNIENHSDSYKNNQYVGVWNQYNSDKTKTCNWGEYRIPYSGDLDIGAGEFSVNPKYLLNGWKL